MAGKLDPEELTIVKKCRVRQHGARYAQPAKAGDKVIVSDYDKIELLSRGLAVPYVKKLDAK